jgi:hypothetical protein
MDCVLYAIISGVLPSNREHSRTIEFAPRRSSISEPLDSYWEMEAPPGFEPGMEVLQGHPRLFLRHGCHPRSRRKSRLLNRLP